MNKLLTTKYSTQCKGALLDLFVQLTKTSAFHFSINEAKQTIDLIFSTDFNSAQISDLMQMCKEWKMYRQLLLPAFLRYIEINLMAETSYKSVNSILLIKSLCKQITSSEIYFSGPFKSSYDGLPLFHFKQSVKDKHKGFISVFDTILKHIDCFCNEEFDLESLDVAWCCVVLLPYIR